jgi:poly-gamma-glutamate synthesis protein (capsule biosynthesis protein)
VLGLNDTEDEYNSIYVYEKEGFKIAILNYTYGLNGIALPSEKPYIVNMMDTEHEDKVVSDIQKAKEMADMVIVCPHWGTEYVYAPDSFQSYWTEKFLELGVDVVVGTHPHVIEPVEVLTREDGHQMLVYYSLGNFVSDQSFIPRMIGAMAKFTLVKEADNTTYIKQYSVIPLVTQKLFGQGLITTYKLSDYTDELADQNDIKANSNECFSAEAYYKCQCGAAALGLETHGGDNFSLSYCQMLCSMVFGDIYDNGGTVVLHE